MDYVWFDFHAECKGMKYENLSKLMKYNAVSTALTSNEFFHIQLNTNNNSNDYQILSTQKGVFRTNCIDCLDRTNVVQTIFSRIITHRMLFKLKLTDMPNFEDLPFNQVFEIIFKNLWADHGDHLSFAYSGTAALKSDFTRTGKRNTQGAIQDGIKTCTRFCINNFNDGYNQDCHDYFLKKITPKNSQFKEHSTSFVKVVTPSAFILTFVLYQCLISVALPVEYEGNIKKSILKMMIFLGVCFLTIKTVFSSLKKKMLDTATMDYF